MQSDTSHPGWNVMEHAHGREIRLRGSWTLLSIARAEPELSRALRALRPRPSDAWVLEDIAGLDSAGALTLWRAWGRRLPERLQWSAEQQPWFRRLQGASTTARRPRPGAYARLARLGGALTQGAADMAQIVLLGGQLLVDLLYCLRHPRMLPWREISATVFRAGAQSLLLVGFIGMLVGMVLAFQLAGQLEQFGANSAIIGAVGLAFLRELGPFLTALILVGRSGSSFTAGIGVMRVTEELDALRAFGVSPTLRVVLPRVLGLTIAAPLLVLWNDFAGMLGAIYVSQTQLNISYRMWLDQFPGAVPSSNYFIGVGKGVLFGALIGLISSYYGLQVEPNTTSLTERTTRAVVVGITLVIAIDGLLGMALSRVGLG